MIYELVFASFAPLSLLRLKDGPPSALATKYMVYQNPDFWEYSRLITNSQSIMVLSSNILDQTPEVIAKWPKANYDNPDQLTWLPIYCCIWFAAATLMVAVRFWLRVRGHAGKFGLDDVSVTHPECSFAAADI